MTTTISTVAAMGTQIPQGTLLASILRQHMAENPEQLHENEVPKRASPIIPLSHISLKGNYYKLGPWWGDI